MNPKKSFSFSPMIVMSIATIVAFGATACGKAPTGSGPVTLQAAPLAGSSAASISRPGAFQLVSVADAIGSGLMVLLLGERTAHASVSSFTSFKICNDTLVMTDVNGETVSVNGSTSGNGLGVLSFSSSSVSDTQLGSSLTIAAGTQIKEIEITSAVVPSTCPSMGSDAVTFDPGSGPIHITQNTAFKFKYSTPVTISGNSQTLTLMFGAIVNGMVNLGAGLNNSTIQTVNVGQAQ